MITRMLAVIAVAIVGIVALQVGGKINAWAEVAEAAVDASPSAPAYVPSESYRAAMAEAKTERCKSHAELARNIMRHRQHGTSMASLMFGDADSSTNAAIIAAYDSPRFATDKHQQRAIADFENDAFLACIKQ